MNTTNLQEIANAVKDIANTTFTFETNCHNVPHYSDQGFTFESGMEKKGKMIETCVLYVDIRNSVALNKKFGVEKMGKLYTSFIKSALWCANHHQGVVRNIIGDRVMIVFPPKDCFTNAVECAVSINTISSKIINHYCKEFKCGIGIDYGKMYVHKTGIIKQGNEESSYKSLIWIGRPANIASRLTDIANKESFETYYEITRNPKNPKAYRHKQGSFPWQLPNLLLGPPERVASEPLYLSSQETIEMSVEKFANSIWQNSVTHEICFLEGKMLSFEKKTRKITHSSILITQSVYDSFIKDNPADKKFWKEVSIEIRDYEGKVYGSNVCWEDGDKIKF